MTIIIRYIINATIVQ